METHGKARCSGALVHETEEEKTTSSGILCQGLTSSPSTLGD